MTGLSGNTEAVLKYVVVYFEKHGVFPTIREIQQALGLAGTNGASYHLDKLVRGGYVKRAYGEARSYVIRRLVDGTEVRPALVPLKTLFNLEDPR